MTYAILAAAAALLFWPNGKRPERISSSSPSPFDIPTAVKGHPGYQSSIMALTLVRQRLIATDSLTEDEKSAIDTLTLSLVAGSDRE